MTLHLLMSLLELSEGLDLLKSVDSTSDIIAGLLFAIYLVMAVILLINMLIALLSNTYQRVQVSLFLEVVLFLFLWFLRSIHVVGIAAPAQFAV